MSNSTRQEIVIYFEGKETGGVTGVIDNLLQTLSSRYQIKLVFRDTKNLNEWFQKYQSSEITGYPLALHNNEDVFGWLDIIRIFKLFKLFRSASIVHFHLHTPFSCLPALFIAKLAGVETLLTTEHYITQLQFLRRRKLIFILDIIREIKINILFFLKKKLLNYLTRTVTVSESNRHFFVETFGLLQESSTITIPNGIDLKKFIIKANQSHNFLDELNLTYKPSHFIVVVAGLNNQKGHEYLIRAIPSVIKEFPQAVFLFVGDGILRLNLERQTKEVNVFENIIFLGTRSDVPYILAISDLFVLPSLFEGMPLSVIEAMAAGKAVVATNVDGTAEVVQDNITGFLVAPKDIEQLAEKILILLKDEQLRIAFGKRGLERVNKFYSRERMALQYKQLYDDLINRHADKPFS
jgi:glycosyltransferase involved in cell wall biosynthesis